MLRVGKRCLAHVSGGAILGPSVAIASPVGVLEARVGGVGGAFTTAGFLPISAGADAHSVLGEGLVQCVQYRGSKG